MRFSGAGFDFGPENMETGRNEDEDEDEDDESERNTVLN
jgi:hypothetical protein